MATATVLVEHLPITEALCKKSTKKKLLTESLSKLYRINPTNQPTVFGQLFGKNKFLLLKTKLASSWVCCCKNRGRRLRNPGNKLIKYNPIQKDQGLEVPYISSVLTAQTGTMTNTTFTGISDAREPTLEVSSKNRTGKYAFYYHGQKVFDPNDTQEDWKEKSLAFQVTFDRVFGNFLFCFRTFQQKVKQSTSLKRKSRCATKIWHRKQLHRSRIKASLIDTFHCIKG